MKDTINIREYQIKDKDSVLNLFCLNTPEFFSVEEEKDLVYYLDYEIEYYFVLEFNNQVVGCGGFNFSGDDTNGKIAWDIVHPDFQGKSFGRKLLDYRIEQMKTFEKLETITVRTSQLAYKFYKKSGFQLMEIEENYWADGFDLYKMGYKL